MLLLLDPLVQLVRSLLDVEVLVPPGATLCREQRAAMNLLKVAVGEFVMPLRVLGRLVVDA